MPSRSRSRVASSVRKRVPVRIRPRAPRGCSSAGRAPPRHGGGHGFEARHPLARRSRPTGRATRSRLWVILVRIQGALRHVVVHRGRLAGLPLANSTGQSTGLLPREFWVRLPSEGPSVAGATGQRGSLLRKRFRVRIPGGARSTSSVGGTDNSPGPQPGKCRFEPGTEHGPIVHG
jgi:hypothetical protein